MKAKIIGLVLLASLSAPAFAGDFEKVLGGVIIGTVIGSQISESNRSPYYYPPQVVYAPPPQVYYGPPLVVYRQPQVVYEQGPVYYSGYRGQYENRYESRYGHRHESRHERHWHHDRRW